MTKFEETEQYWDNFFIGISKMDEAQLNEFMLQLDEAAVINSLKQQIARIRKTMEKQESAIREIKNIIRKDVKNPNADRLLKGIESQMEKAEKTKKELDKYLPLMEQLAKDIDDNSNTFGGQRKDVLYNQEGKAADSRANLTSNDLHKVMKDELKNKKKELGA